MTANNYAACFDIVMQSEGSAFDPTGPSKYGILQSTLSAWLGHQATVQDVQNLTITTVSSLMEADYFALSGCGQLANGLDLMVFDSSVQHGVGTAVRMLQRALGVKADTVFGPVTAAAAATSNTAKMIDAIVAQRSTLYHSLATWPQFGTGWMARLYRTAADAHAMVGSPQPQHDDILRIEHGDGSVTVSLNGQPIDQPIEPTPTNDLGIPPLPPIIPAPLATQPSAKPKVTPTVAGVTVGVGTVAVATAVVVGAPHMTAVNLAPILDPAIQVAGLVLTVIAAWLAPLLAKRIGVSTQSALMQNLLGAVDRGISYGQQQATSLAAQDANVNVTDATQAAALSYVVQKMPGTISKLGISPQHVADLIVAKLPTGTAQ